MSPWFTRKSGTLGSQGLTGSSTHRGGKRRPTSRRAERPEAAEIGEDRFGRNRVSPGGPGRWLRTLVSLLQFTLLATLLVCAGYQSHYIFFKALYFRIQEITVEGAQALESHEVVALSGISLGDLFFKYNYERVKDRVRRHPRVKDVRVVVKSPNSIKLQIEEKLPRFYLQHGDEQLEIDENGVVLGPRDHTEPLPLVRGAELADENSGEGADGIIPEELEAELRLPDPDDPPLTSQPATDETTSEDEPPLPSPPTPQLRVRHRKVLAEWVPALAKSPLKEYEAIEVANPHEIVVEWKGVKFLVSRVDRFFAASELIQPILLEAQNKGLEVTRLDLRFPNPILKFKTKVLATDGVVAGAVGVTAEGVPTEGATPEVAVTEVTATGAEAGTEGTDTGTGLGTNAGVSTTEPAIADVTRSSGGDEEAGAAFVDEIDAEAFERLEVPAGEEPPEAFIEETAFGPASEVGPGVFEGAPADESGHDLESFFGGAARPEPAGPPAGWGRPAEGYPPAGPTSGDPTRPLVRPDARPWPPSARPSSQMMDVPGTYPGGER